MPSMTSSAVWNVSRPRKLRESGCTTQLSDQLALATFHFEIVGVIINYAGCGGMSKNKSAAMLPGGAKIISMYY